MNKKIHGQQLPMDAQILEESPEQRPLFCTRRQLKALFGIKTQTAANWASGGIGPKYYRVGKLAVYEVKEVIEFLTMNPVQTTGRI